MLWVYGHYYYFYNTARGPSLYIRVYRHQILKHKDSPSAERVNIFAMLIASIAHFSLFICPPAKVSYKFARLAYVLIQISLIMVVVGCASETQLLKWSNFRAHTCTCLSCQSRTYCSGMAGTTNC